MQVDVSTEADSATPLGARHGGRTDNGDPKMVDKALGGGGNWKTPARRTPSQDPAADVHRGHRGLG